MFIYSQGLLMIHVKEDTVKLAANQMLVEFVA